MLLVTAVVMTSCSFLGKSGSQQSTILQSTGTTYVVTDASSGGDSGVLEGKNFSTQDFINVWYQWNVQATEKDISVGLVQFDISSLKNKDIKSATLQMFVTSDTLSEPARLVDISLVTDKFDPKTVTFNNKPNWSATGIASSVVYGAGVWSSWDVTASVISGAKSGTVAYAAGLDTMSDKTQEQVMFASNNVAASAPRLLVTYASTSSGFPIWFWIALIVVIALIAFFAGWMITRRAPKKAVAEVKPDDKKSTEKNGKSTSANKSFNPDRKPSIFDDVKPNDPPK